MFDRDESAIIHGIVFGVIALWILLRWLLVECAA